jgi:hypothetical protein
MYTNTREMKCTHRVVDESESEAQDKTRDKTRDKAQVSVRFDCDDTWSLFGCTIWRTPVSTATFMMPSLGKDVTDEAKVKQDPAATVKQDPAATVKQDPAAAVKQDSRNAQMTHWSLLDAPPGSSTHQQFAPTSHHIRVTTETFRIIAAALQGEYSTDKILYDAPESQYSVLFWSRWRTFSMTGAGSGAGHKTPMVYPCDLAWM